MAHCSDHDACLGKIHEKLDEIKEAVCGGKDTIGQAEEIRDLKKRVARLEEILSTAKKGVWDLFQKVLPWLLLVLMAGLQAKGYLSQQTSPVTHPLPQNVGNTLSK